MKAYLSVKRTINLKTGEYQDVKRWVELEPEQIEAFCRLIHSQAPEQKKRSDAI